MKLTKTAALFGGSVALTALAGSFFNPSRGNTREWYSSLEKPPFMPPSSVFGPVWTVLYALIAWSGIRVANAPADPARTPALAAWGTQLAINGLWSPLFFGAKKPALAMADIGLLLAAIVAYLNYARRVDKPAAWMLSPYVLWVTFATVLNAEIVRRN